MEITEKKLKQIFKEQREEYQIYTDKSFKEQREEYQGYIGILKEDFDSNVRLIAESVSGIQEQLIIIRDMVVKNTEDIKMIKMDMEAMKADINTTKADMEVMKVDINTTKVDMEIMKSDINIIKNDLKQRVALEDFNTLEKRVILLEAKMRKI